MLSKTEPGTCRGWGRGKGPGPCHNIAIEISKTERDTGILCLPQCQRPGWGGI